MSDKTEIILGTISVGSIMITHFYSIFKIINKENDIAKNNDKLINYFKFESNNENIKSIDEVYKNTKKLKN